MAFHTGRDPLSPNLIHCPPDVLGKIADLFPRLTIIAAHMGGMDLPEEAAKHLANKPNVYFDTAFASHFLDVAGFTELVKLVGGGPRALRHGQPLEHPAGGEGPARRRGPDPGGEGGHRLEKRGGAFSASPFDISPESGYNSSKELCHVVRICHEEDHRPAAGPGPVPAGRLPKSQRRPDGLSRGYGKQLKLLHLNASTGENLQLMEDFGGAIQDAEPLDRDIRLFAYYPDYLLELTGQEEGQTVTALIDINGEFVDFIYPAPTRRPTR